MKKAEIVLALENLEKAYLRLKDAVQRAQDDLDKDGVIQRFEFTVELVWKTLKRVLEYNKLNCYSPRDCLKQAFRYGFIEDDEIILDMLDDRNRSSHIYDEATSEEIFIRIKKVYVQAIEQILKELYKRI